MSGDRPVVEAYPTGMDVHNAVEMRPIYRPFAEVRIPRSRRQRFVGRMRLRVWEWRYRLAQAIYPFAEEMR